MSACKCVKVGEEWKGFLKRALDQLLREQLNRQGQKAASNETTTNEREREKKLMDGFEHVRTRSDEEEEERKKMI